MPNLTCRGHLHVSCPLLALLSYLLSYLPVVFDFVFTFRLSWPMDNKVLERHLKSICLRFGVGKSVPEGFTDVEMSGDVDSS